MFYHDEMIDIVSAANISGHMESSGKIAISDDEELLNFITRNLDAYKDQHDNGGEDTGNWYDWIEAALLKEYGY